MLERVEGFPVLEELVNVVEPVDVVEVFVAVEVVDDTRVLLAVGVEAVIVEDGKGTERLL